MGESFVVERFWESRAGRNERGGGDTLGGSQISEPRLGMGGEGLLLHRWAGDSLPQLAAGGREQQGVGAAPLWENCVIHSVYNCVRLF